MKRLLVDIFLIFLITYTPWWCVVITAFIAAIYFLSFYELLLVGIVLDSLYNAPTVSFLNFEFVITVATIFLFIFAEILKKRLRVC
jgi:hypothetical protein